MSIELILRLVGMVVFAVIGVQLAPLLQISPGDSDTSLRLSIAMSLSFAALGLLITPWITLKPFNWVRYQIRRLPASRLIAAIFGLAIGLAIAALLTAPLSTLPPPFNKILPISISLIFGYIGIAIMVMRHQDITALLNAPLLVAGNRGGNKAAPSPFSDALLLDSSVIIDGRIADISQTGFLRGTLLVPRFVLNEVQHVSDSSDALRRSRGRRGLEILSQLQENAAVPLRITDRDFEHIKEVDDKLVMLAKQLRCPILTTDYGLNRVAKLQGVTVLNINELTNAVKNIYLPGETLALKIIQEGKEYGQGVGYLDDGTMVVVQGGSRHIDRILEITVTKVLQTAAGRMIFAQPEK
ncbi:MAG TPA: TRAM domain-containing protein [Chloroflexi bacterium]|nr:MAG: twitching motility protein PilT [Anaerolineaceae bacterium 4572_5.2]HEY83937.1 TRAM domain-containing protein [Chloroflexota bacterium]